MSQNETSMSEPGFAVDPVCPIGLQPVDACPAECPGSTQGRWCCVLCRREFDASVDAAQHLDGHAGGTWATTAVGRPDSRRKRD